MHHLIKLATTGIVLVIAIAVGMTASAMYGFVGPNPDGAPRANLTATATSSATAPLAPCARSAACAATPAIESELTCEEAQACACGPNTMCALATPDSCDDVRICAFTPCSPDAPIEDCYPNARPAGPYVCSTLPASPPIVRCLPAYCEESSPAGPLATAIAKAIATDPLTGRVAQYPVPCLPYRCAYNENCAPPCCDSLPEQQSQCPPRPPDCAIASDDSTACPPRGPISEPGPLTPQRPKELQNEPAQIPACPPICLSPSPHDGPAIRLDCGPIVCVQPAAPAVRELAPLCVEPEPCGPAPIPDFRATPDASRSCPLPPCLAPASGISVRRVAAVPPTVVPRYQAPPRVPARPVVADIGRGARRNNDPDRCGA